MLLFCNHANQRILYIADFIGRQLIGYPLSVSSDVEAFITYAGPKINYSNNRLTPQECWCAPHTLLFEKGIKKQEIHLHDNNGQPAFFKTAGDMEFDFLAATFYLLSRYEEYLPHTKDEYGRYAYKNSIAWNEGLLNKPVINSWLEAVKGVLKNKYPDFQFPPSFFRFLPTYDIDEAYAFLHKPWWRRIGGEIKCILTGNFKKFWQHNKVLRGKMPDPYDTYQWMNNLHEKFGLHPAYFFLAAQKNKQYDKNILPSAPAIKALIKQHAVKYTIGIHPSWQSGHKAELLKQEKELLEQIATKPVTASRQHYIRFTLPDTYRQLLAIGIAEDHSMGYGSINGFRASVASPFYWYDLQKEEQTSLLLYPFCFMDANSFYEQKQTAIQTAQELWHYYEVVKKVNGTLITLWHNNFFGSDERFKGWKEVYEEFLKKALNK
jgi:hypothetical protein